MEKNRGYYRHQRIAHIARKKRIIREHQDNWAYKFDGQLSKGKIHCSCEMCRVKSYDRLSAKDRRRIEAMNYSD